MGDLTRTTADSSRLVFPFTLMEKKRRSKIKISYEFIYITHRDRVCVREREEGNVLFNDVFNTFYFTVIWRRTYGKGPLK